MPDKEKISPKDASDDGNIFDEFSIDSSVQEEVASEEKKEKGSLYVRLSIVRSFLTSVNIIFFSIFCIFGFYYFVQMQGKSEGYSFLSPICSVFLGSADYSGNCTGVSAALENAEQKKEELTKSQYENIVTVLPDLYSLKNLGLSQELVFLSDRTNNRLAPIKILSEFDALKSEFSSSDKSDIECYDLSINNVNQLAMKCDIYSSDWDSFVWVFEDGEKTKNKGGGTSISRAASFIDFLKYSSDAFQVVSAPENFQSSSAQKPPYTQSTTINIVLKYNTQSLDL